MSRNLLTNFAASSPSACLPIPWEANRPGLAHMHSDLIALILPAADLKQFFFDWYPVFGVLFMACLLLVFLRLMRSTMSARPSRRR